MSTALLVEDELLIRELACEYLRDFGFEVTIARDATEAMGILREGNRFDLLFTDIRMPGGMDGRDLAREAKQMIGGLRVIYATGYAEGGAPLEGSEKLIGKPYTMSALREALNMLGFDQSGLTGNAPAIS
jgi:CheY-like chemotaxis protein